VGIALIVDEDGALEGVFTDGDLRRHLLAGGSGSDIDIRPVREVMIRNPKTVEADVSASEALRIMEVHGGITALPIVGSRGQPVGLIEIHDMLGRGQITV
jgi:arabinose-5-phosphate isomerase